MCIGISGFDETTASLFFTCPEMAVFVHGGFWQQALSLSLSLEKIEVCFLTLLQE